MSKATASGALGMVNSPWALVRVSQFQELVPVRDIVTWAPGMGFPLASMTRPCTVLPAASLNSIGAMPDSTLVWTIIGAKFLTETVMGMEPAGMWASLNSPLSLVEAVLP